MMGLIGMGNNPMVGATVAVAVSIEEAAKLVSSNLKNGILKDTIQQMLNGVFFVLFKFDTVD